MYTIAKLLAENMSRFGLEYDKQQGKLDTVEYYYGQAILKYREALRYHLEESKAAHVLRFIGHRYHDLAACLPIGSDHQSRAVALAEAYYASAVEYGYKE